MAAVLLVGPESACRQTAATGANAQAGVRYFTARVIPDAGSVDKARRQNIYLEALGTLPDLDIHYGYYLPKMQRCSTCGTTWQTYEEKMTDVNIAVELLSDAYDDAFDTAIVVSADSDLARPITTIRERFPGKRVVVAFPAESCIKVTAQRCGRIVHDRPRSAEQQPVSRACCHI